jgi:hypothetical protein
LSVAGSSTTQTYMEHAKQKKSLMRPWRRWMQRALFLPYQRIPWKRLDAQSVSYACIRCTL